jgi:hypothetical protein
MNNTFVKPFIIKPSTMPLISAGAPTTVPPSLSSAYFVFQYDSEKICNIFIGQISILQNKNMVTAFPVFSLQFDDGNKNAVENVVIF